MKTAKKIKLTMGYEAIVSRGDWAKLKNIKWRAIPKGGNVYAGRTVIKNGKRTTEYMHRVIVNAPHGKDVDHRDGNGLNNQRNNLRVCEHRQNMRNLTKLPSTNTSGVLGVCWHGRHKKWNAKITVNDKRIHLGYFDDIEDAIAARKKAEEKYFGRFAPADINKK